MGLLGLFGSNAVQESAEGLKDKRIVVNKNRCPQNHRCPSIRVCPVDALTQKGFAAPRVDMDACIKCGKCIKYCPMRAISFQ